MCDLLNLNRDTYYENVKSAILDKLDQNISQMNAIEEYVWAVCHLDVYLFM